MKNKLELFYAFGEKQYKLWDRGLYREFYAYYDKIDKEPKPRIAGVYIGNYDEVKKNVILIKYNIILPVLNNARLPFYEDEKSLIKAIKKGQKLVIDDNNSKTSVYLNNFENPLRFVEYYSLGIPNKDAQKIIYEDLAKILQKINKESVKNIKDFLLQINVGCQNSLIA